MNRKAVRCQHEYVTVTPPHIELRCAGCGKDVSRMVWVERKASA